MQGERQLDSLKRTNLFGLKWQNITVYLSYHGRKGTGVIREHYWQHLSFPCNHKSKCLLIKKPLKTSAHLLQRQVISLILIGKTSTQNSVDLYNLFVVICSPQSFLFSPSSLLYTNWCCFA